LIGKVSFHCTHSIYIKQVDTHPTTPEVQNPFSQFRGISTAKMTTEQILNFTRDYG